jgi:hypothetical protein
VRLPALWGIKPGKYLAALYLTCVLAVLFFIFAFPGIVRPGSLVTLTSEPSGAAVRVDDVFFNATPCTIFIDKGRRVIDITLPGFSVFHVEKDVGRGRMAVHAELEEKSPLSALTLGAASAAEWSFTGENAEMYQTPLALSEGVYRSAPADRRAADEIIRAAARFTSTRAFLKDLMRAKFLAGNAGRAPSMFKAAETIAEIAAFISYNPAFTCALVDLLGEDAVPLLESEWYRKNVINVVFPVQNLQNPQQAPQNNRINRYDPVFDGDLTVAGVRFVGIQGGIFKASTDFNYETPLEYYYIGANEVSDREWDDFLLENPEWRQENTAGLIEKRVVNPQYMAKPDNKEYPAPTVSGVSWFAADAYCRWLTGKLPPGFSGWTVRLPSELEWEYAAKGTLKGLDGGRISRMTQDDGNGNGAGQAGLWEWCADPFVPVYFLGAAEESIAAVGSPKRGVRGGSWVNPARTVSAETRAGLIPRSCSPFVSFRPVIARTVSAGNR